MKVVKVIFTNLFSKMPFNFNFNDRVVAKIDPTFSNKMSTNIKSPKQASGAVSKVATSAVCGLFERSSGWGCLFNHLSAIAN
jgi:hypothetical protein